MKITNIAVLKIKDITIASIHLVCLILVCYLNELFVESNYGLAGLFFPGFIWGILFFAFNFKYVKDKTFSGIGFITSNLVFWPLMLLIGGTFGMMLYSIQPILLFPLVGGLAAICAYYLFSLFIISIYLPKQAFATFLLGIVSFIIVEIYNSSLQIYSLIFAWELLVGSGLIYFGIKQRHKGFS